MAVRTVYMRPEAAQAARSPIYEEPIDVKHPTGIPTGTLEKIFNTIRVPFEVQCEDSSLKPKAKKLFQILYSKDFFGSGTQACSFVLDAFAKIASTPSSPVRVSITSIVASSANTNYLGGFQPSSRIIVIESTHLKDLNIENPNDERVLEFMGTVLHEMTHAIHYGSFLTAACIKTDYLNPGDVFRELGCSKEKYEADLRSASEKAPTGWALMNPAFTLTGEMWKLFIIPARLVDQDKLVLAFNEFFARIPQMFCQFGNSYSAKEIHKALEDIFPLGNQFFWNQFKKRCEEISLVALPFLEQSPTENSHKTTQGSNHHHRIIDLRKPTEKTKIEKSITLPSPDHKEATSTTDPIIERLEPLESIELLIQRIEALKADKPSAKRAQRLHALFEELKIDKHIKYSIYHAIGRKAGQVTSAQREYGRAHFADSLSGLQKILLEFPFKAGTSQHPLSAKDQKKQEILQLQSRSKEISSVLEEVETRMADLRSQLATLATKKKSLQSELEQKTKAIQRLQTPLRSTTMPRQDAVAIQDVPQSGFSRRNTRQGTLLRFIP